jgi:hypothetical protein
MDSPGNDAAPFKSIAEELQGLRTTLRGTVETYFARLDAEIVQVTEAVEKEAAKKKVTTARQRDLRDMLILLRNASVKTDKGRRKDLKKIDGLVGDLAMLTENW